MPEWVTRWGYEVAARPARPGVYRLKGGGFLVRGRITDRGKRRTVIKALRSGTLAEAQRVLDELKEERRARLSGNSSAHQLFATYATSLLKRKVGTREIKSAKTLERWEGTLRLHLIPAFGSYAMSELRRAHVEAWKETLGPRIAAGALSPRTANGWLSILRVVVQTGVAELELERDATLGVTDFPVDECPAYTDEEPNALTGPAARRFLEQLRADWPQHYAMTLLGFVTGLRPSSLRPLRRSGPEADVLWDEGILLVRRSNSLRQIVLNTTKTGRRQRIGLPPEVVAVLREHVAWIEASGTAKQQTSELLFPARHGGMRTRSVLDKPFLAVSRAIGLPYRLTPRGMRRTFQDLARAAAVHDVVTRSISGHATEQMHRHYSTAAMEEQRTAIGQVIRLVGPRGAMGGAR